mmetsp:Transcript_41935/g.48549  ORF Transcript_41935/g.48549 Transcript_41935/m.48549 type:complete len:101 (-) Transcript_41935:112-414(-)
MSGYIVYNFCITLTVKGIEHFYRKAKIFDDKKDEIIQGQKAIIVYETGNKKEKIDEYQEKADKLVEAAAYSYLLISALQYEIVDAKELRNREFRKAVVIL